MLSAISGRLCQDKEEADRLTGGAAATSSAARGDRRRLVTNAGSKSDAHQ
jgi:hypothetical protein